MGLRGRACPVASMECPNRTHRKAAAARSAFCFRLPLPGAALARWNLPVPAVPAGTCCPVGLPQLPGHVISQTLTLPLSRRPHFPGAYKHVFLSTASSVPQTQPGLSRLGPEGLWAALSTWPRGLLAVQLPRRRVSNRRPVLLSPTVSKTHS